MRLRRRLAFVALLPLLFVAAGFEAGQAPPKPKPEDQIVYVTKTGAKYHAASCRSLSKSKIPMTLGDAAKRYGACALCKPPVLHKK